MSGRWDAVVVGAGPAGASAARALAAAGARTLLLERRPLPRAKTCGGGLVGRGRGFLPADLDLLPERSSYAIELRLADAGLAFRVERAEPVVTMTMRADLDLALARAAERAGAVLRTGSAFRGLARARRGLTVTTEHGPLAAGLVVGADGVTSAVARAGGWRADPPCAPALEAEVAVGAATLARFADAARFDVGFPPAGYAWIFPKRAHLSVGCLVTRRGPAGLKARLAEVLARTGITDVRGMEVSGQRIPLAPRPGGVARDRVLLAGDAAGLADPVTAEGISFALQSGALAGEAWLAAGGDPARATLGYARLVRARIGRELAAARFLARLLYGAPALRAAAFRRVGPELCEALTDVVLGERTYRGLLARPLRWLPALAAARLGATRSRAS